MSALMTGELACGSEGRGRLAPVEEIVEKAKEILLSIQKI